MRRVDLANIETASNETTRNINRNLALNLIRARQPVSRAELARLSGLQRSTVSLIIEQLIREKWVVEGARGRLPRGRRPTFLYLNELRAIIVVDIHPGTANLALADATGSLHSQETIVLDEDARAGVKQIVAAIKALRKRHPERIFEGIGISVPGGVDEKQRLIFAPNLKWTNYDIRAAIERGTGLHVELENAANTSVLGEIWFGETSGVNQLAVVAVAEGIGVGVVSNGQLVRGLHGMAGEFGHVSIDPNGPLCQCGGRGCWEMFASNRAAERYYQQSRRKSSGASFDELLQMAENGDGPAEKSLRQMATHLGLGLRMIVAAYAPETIMISGKIATQWHRYGPLLEASLREHMLAGSPPRLIASRDGALSRLRGGIALVLQRYSSRSFK